MIKMFSGYYDDNGQRLREGDYVRAVCEGEVIVGEIFEVEDNMWCVLPEKNEWAPQVWQCDSVVKISSSADINGSDKNA